MDQTDKSKETAPKNQDCMKCCEGCMFYIVCCNEALKEME